MRPEPVEHRRRAPRRGAARTAASTSASGGSVSASSSDWSSCVSGSGALSRLGITRQPLALLRQHVRRALHGGLRLAQEERDVLELASGRACAASGRRAARPPPSRTAGVRLLLEDVEQDRRRRSAAGPRDTRDRPPSAGTRSRARRGSRACRRSPPCSRRRRASAGLPRASPPRPSRSREIASPSRRSTGADFQRQIDVPVAQEDEVALPEHREEVVLVRRRLAHALQDAEQLVQLFGLEPAQQPQLAHAVLVEQPRQAVAAASTSRRAPSRLPTAPRSR